MQEMKITLEQSPELLEVLRRIAEALEAAPPQEKAKRSRKKAVEKEEPKSVTTVNGTSPAPVQPGPEVTNPVPVDTPQQTYATQTPVQQAPIAPVAQSPAVPPTGYQTASPAPVAPAQQYTHEILQIACAPLMDMGLGQQLQNLLAHFGVQRVTDIPGEYLGAFATELRRLGAKI